MLFLRWPSSVGWCWNGVGVGVCGREMRPCPCWMSPSIGLLLPQGADWDWAWIQHWGRRRGKGFWYLLISILCAKARYSLATKPWIGSCSHSRHYGPPSVLRYSNPTSWTQSTKTDRILTLSLHRLVFNSFELRNMRIILRGYTPLVMLLNNTGWRYFLMNVGIIQYCNLAHMKYQFHSAAVDRLAPRLIESVSFFLFKIFLLLIHFELTCNWKAITPKSLCLWKEQNRGRNIPSH